MSEISAPVMFIGHGSPRWALSPGAAAARLVEYSALFSNVKALLVISPHWITRGMRLTASSRPETIHDFGGFEKALYQLQYPVAGDPELACHIQSVLQDSGLAVELDEERGLDHGVWVPLLHMLPDHRIPVLQLSLDAGSTPDSLVKLGAQLGQLRDEGVAIIASGSLTHNLYHMGEERAEPLDYVVRFQNWAREQVVARNISALSQPHIESDDFATAHPSAEHYLPLLIAMGASHDSDQLSVLQSSILYQALSMESYGWN
ncbi:class III extradiol ring-cleavage dioxygenase [uncultured Amphritea sp.]|uniref:DODA-type extradiol aromatic ring-opening family dioxygenase n=1 Tax=uncultured Amphritea sp. TaxID=981605 RepID=UPI002631ABBD|nr:class III extradiol ring-cleavage dioxygenase [uncultured Amphritea sp.]